MNMNGFNPNPLNIDPEFPGHVRAQLERIMSAGVYDADEYALIALKEAVVDGLHLGRVTITDHDALVNEIGEARMTLR